MRLLVGVACAALGGLCLSARADESQWTFLYTVEDGATHEVGQKGDGKNNANSNSNSTLFKGSATVLGVDQLYSLAIKDNKLVLVVKRFGFGMIFR